MFQVAIGIIIAVIALALLFKYPKQIGYVFLALIVIGGGCIFYLYQESQNRKAQKALVTAVISYDLVKCTKEYPLFIGFVNDSRKIVNEIEFGIYGYRKGYSRAVYRSGYLEGYETDKIMKPNTGWGICWKIPERVGPANVFDQFDEIEWEVKIRYVAFKK